MVYFGKSTIETPKSSRRIVLADSYLDPIQVSKLNNVWEKKKLPYRILKHIVIYDTSFIISNSGSKTKLTDTEHLTLLLNWYYGWADADINSDLINIKSKNPVSFKINNTHIELVFRQNNGNNLCFKSPSFLKIELKSNNKEQATLHSMNLAGMHKNERLVKCNRCLLRGLFGKGIYIAIFDQPCEDEQKKDVNPEASSSTAVTQISTANFINTFISNEKLICRGYVENDGVQQYKIKVNTVSGRSELYSSEPIDVCNRSNLSNSDRYVFSSQVAVCSSSFIIVDEENDVVSEDPILVSSNTDIVINEEDYDELDDIRVDNDGEHPPVSPIITGGGCDDIDPCLIEQLAALNTVNNIDIPKETTNDSSPSYMNEQSNTMSDEPIESHRKEDIQTKETEPYSSKNKSVAPKRKVNQTSLDGFITFANKKKKPNENIEVSRGNKDSIDTSKKGKSKKNDKSSKKSKNTTDSDDDVDEEVLENTNFGKNGEDGVFSSDDEDGDSGDDNEEEREDREEEEEGDEDGSEEMADFIVSDDEEEAPRKKNNCKKKDNIISEPFQTVRKQSVVGESDSDDDEYIDDDIWSEEEEEDVEMGEESGDENDDQDLKNYRSSATLNLQKLKRQRDSQKSSSTSVECMDLTTTDGKMIQIHPKTFPKVVPECLAHLVYDENENDDDD
jgi:hypothetical protein